MHAVIATGGKQYRVAEGDLIRVEKLDVPEGEQVVFEALAVGDGSALRVGEEAKGARVVAEVVEHGKGKKIVVFKRKRRKNYRRTRGHRQWYTAVRIISIEG